MQVEINNQEVTLTFHHDFQGRGGWNIICKAEFEGKEKIIKLYSRNETFINFISEMISSKESFENVQNAYFMQFYDDIIEDLEVFVNDTNRVERAMKALDKGIERASKNWSKVDGVDEFLNEMRD